VSHKISISSASRIIGFMTSQLVSKQPRLHAHNGKLKGRSNKILKQQ